MKKSLLILGALAMLSVAFVGCKGNGDTTGDDASDPAITDPTGGEEPPTANEVDFVMATPGVFKPFEDQIKRSDIEGVKKIKITFTANNASDYDYVGKVFGWKQGTSAWEDDVDYGDDYIIKLNGTFTAGKTYTQEFDVAKFLRDAPNMCAFTFNIWPVSETNTDPKITITKVTFIK